MSKFIINLVNTMRKVKVFSVLVNSNLFSDLDSAYRALDKTLTTSQACCIVFTG